MSRVWTKPIGLIQKMITSNSLLPISRETAVPLPVTVQWNVAPSCGFSLAQSRQRKLDSTLGCQEKVQLVLHVRSSTTSKNTRFAPSRQTTQHMSMVVGLLWEAVVQLANVVMLSHLLPPSRSVCRVSNLTALAGRRGVCRGTALRGAASAEGFSLVLDLDTVARLWHVGAALVWTRMSSILRHVNMYLTTKWG